MHGPAIALVRRKTGLEGLLARWATRGAARFKLKQARVQELVSGGAEVEEAELDADEDFSSIEDEDAVYQNAIDQLQRDLDFGLPVQVIDREYLPTFDFGRFTVIVVVGPDGLVANTAKYAGEVPIVGVNPDPHRVDGVLLPFQLGSARRAVQRVINQQFRTRDVTLAEAVLQDGQRLLAFNDLFIGCNSHVSARYRLSMNGQDEPQSSSGIIVSTGAGSTGWLSSVFNMVAGVTQFLSGPPQPRPALAWEDRRLAWVVREPFVSRQSQASLVAGLLNEGQTLSIESRMPANGVIFSDGVEADFIEFNGGSIAHIGVAEQRARLVFD